MVITFILAIHLLSFQQGITQDAEGPNTIRHSISQALSIEASDPTTALQYLSKAIVQAEKSQDRGLLIEACLIKARILVKADNLEEALLTANRALILALEVGRESQVEQAYFLLSNIYLSKDLVSESFEFLYGGYKLSEQLRDSTKLSWYLVNLSRAEQQMGQLSNAMEISLKAKEYFENSHDTLTLAITQNTLGLIHLDLGNYTTAQAYLESATSFFQQKGNNTLLGSAYSNQARLFLLKQNIDEAERLSLKASGILEPSDRGVFLRNQTLQGSILLFRRKYTLAIEMLSGIARQQQQLNDKYGLTTTYLELGKAYSQAGLYHQAIEVYSTCIKMSRGLGLINYTRQAYLGLANATGSLKEYATAYLDLNRYVRITDSLFNLQKISEINRLESQALIMKKEKEILDQKALLIQNAEKLRQQKQKQALLYLIIALSFGVIAFAFREFRLKKNANAELARQKQQIEEQKSIAERRNRDITDSLNYARRIQQAILRASAQCKDFFPDSFIVFIPKELVSGDFYWFKKINNQTLFAIADCTGHGTPGAFMSIIGTYGLNRIVSELNYVNPGDILNSLNDLFQTSFEQREGSEIFDGMDIGLCNYDNATRELKFAGANIQLHVLRRSDLPPVSSNIATKTDANTLYQLKCEKQPIGYLLEKVEYTTHSVRLMEGDILYLFTDGYADQFGGPHGKKFRLQELRNLIVSIAPLSLDEQKTILESTYKDWKGNHTQVDDVSFIGIKIT